MIDAEFVERLIRAVDESGIDTVEIRRGGTRVRISKTPPPAPVPTEAGAGPLRGQSSQRPPGTVPRLSRRNRRWRAIRPQGNSRP